MPQRTFPGSWSDLGNGLPDASQPYLNQLGYLPDLGDNPTTSSFYQNSSNISTPSVPFATFNPHLYFDASLMSLDDRIYPQQLPDFQPQLLPPDLFQNNVSIFQDQMTVQEDVGLNLDLTPDLESRQTIDIPSTRTVLSRTRGGQFSASDSESPTRALLSSEMNYFNSILSSQSASRPLLGASELSFTQDESLIAKNQLANFMPLQGIESTHLESFTHATSGRVDEFQKNLATQKPCLADNGQKRVLGLSRSILLPPLRKGGRKTPLTSQERTSRK